MIPRRRCLQAMLALGAGNWALADPLFGSPVASQESKSLLDEATEAAIQRGLRYLADQQNEDGSFGDDDYARNVGVCSLIGLAFLASGSTPGRGRWGLVLDRVIGFVLDQAKPNGFITVAPYQSRGPMYGHGFATLLLSEVLGMSRDPRVSDTVTRAVQVIQDSQNDAGGWRYEPRRDDADVSVTACQLMALRAARNGGIFVAEQVVDRAVGYLKNAQNPDGGFLYMEGERESAFPRSAAALVALYNAGLSGTPELEAGIRYLMRFLPGPVQGLLPSHFFYGHYYAVQALWHAGGARWQQWYRAIQQTLLPLQQEDGQWQDLLSPRYATAMATIILQVPNNLLPILQR